jgi:hypothetical protein
MGNTGFVESCESHPLQKPLAANGAILGQTGTNSTIK